MFAYTLIHNYLKASMVFQTSTIQRKDIHEKRKED